MIANMISYLQVVHIIVYEVIFYTDKNDNSELIEYIKYLREHSSTKDSRIKLAKILAYLNKLKAYGTKIGEPYIKHLDGAIWELRPIRDRILFAYWKNNKFILLHYFMKKTQKTPTKEIEQAKRNLKDYIERGGGNE